MLDHLRIFSVEGIALVENEINAATKRPDVNLLAEAVLLENQLGSRVINMAAEVTSSEQLLEVVRKTHGVEFDDSASELLDSAWMHITMYIVLAMKVF